MKKRQLIPVSEIGEYFRVDTLTVVDFADFGLFPAVSDGDGMGIDFDNMERLRKVFSLHLALGVNKEGIDIILELRDAIAKLEERVETLGRDNVGLRKRLEKEDPETLERLGLLIEIL